MPIVQIIYTCNDFSGDITREQEEVSELKWFDINEIIKAYIIFDMIRRAGEG